MWLTVEPSLGIIEKMRGIAHYDCEPLAMAQLEGMSNSAGWPFCNAGLDAAAIMREVAPGNRGLAVYDAPCPDRSSARPCRSCPP